MEEAIECFELRVHWWYTKLNFEHYILKIHNHRSLYILLYYVLLTLIMIMTQSFI